MELIALVGGPCPHLKGSLHQGLRQGGSQLLGDGERVDDAEARTPLPLGKFKLLITTVVVAVTASTI